MITQLDPPLPMETPKGKGWAYFILDYGQDHHLWWVVFLDATGECWTVANPEVRIQSNWTLGRGRVQSGSTPGGSDAVSYTHLQHGGTLPQVLATTCHLCHECHFVKVSLEPSAFPLLHFEKAKSH